MGIVFIILLKTELKYEAHWSGCQHMEHGVVCLATSHSPSLWGRNLSLQIPKRISKR